MQALVWSLGAAIDAPSRANFESTLRGLCDPSKQPPSAAAAAAAAASPSGKKGKARREATMPPNLLTGLARPTGCSAWDLCYDRKQHAWLRWMDESEPYVVPELSDTAPLHAVLVPTMATARVEGLLRLLHSVRVPAHLCSATCISPSLHLSLLP